MRRTTTGVTCTRHYGVAARTTAGGLTWIAADHHGTGQVAVNPTTLAVGRRKSDPFGNPRGPAAAWPTTRGFVNGIQDATGMTHLGAREYEPAAGRFVSVDPVMNLADPTQWNGYTYANSSPVTSSDSGGLVPCNNHGDDGAFCPGNTAGPAAAPRVPPPPPSLPHCEIAGACAHPVNDPCPIAGGCMAGKPDPGLTNVSPHVAVSATNPYVPGMEAAYQKAVHGWFRVDDPTHLDLEIELQVWKLICNNQPGVCGPELTQWINELMPIPGISSPDGNGVGDRFGRYYYGYGMASGKELMGKGAPAAGGAGAGRRSACRNSFDPDTPVLMAGGTTKPIKDVKVGDTVVATDPETGHTGAEVVIDLHLNLDTKLTNVTIADARGVSTVVHTTEEHPFWDATRHEWTPASQLSPGDLLYTSTGTPVRVVAVQSLTRPAAMYNLTILDIHTYYVIAGNISVLVHNVDGCVYWVPENANMSSDAAAYDAGAVGSRPGRAPALDYVNARGNVASVKFDGFDEVGGVMIDRKISVTTFPKTYQQAINQSLALEQNGYAGVWEVTTQAQANRANMIFSKLGITNISVRVVAP